MSSKSQTQTAEGDFQALRGLFSEQGQDVATVIYMRPLARCGVALELAGRGLGFRPSAESP